MEYTIRPAKKFKSVTVVIPTIGKKELSDAVHSVLVKDTIFDITLLIVKDGPDIEIKSFSHYTKNPNIITLPWNVGANGFYGHRIYAAASHLVNTDAVMFLDEDNFYDENHIETCMNLMNLGDYDFVHSYRNVVDGDGSFVCRDAFEAIGAEPLDLVDTSSYCFSTEFLIKTGYLWHHGWGADRRYFQAVKDTAKYNCTRQFSLNYRLDGNPGSPSKEFFMEGNVMNGYSATGYLDRDII